MGKEFETGREIGGQLFFANFDGTGEVFDDEFELRIGSGDKGADVSASPTDLEGFVRSGLTEHLRKTHINNRCIPQTRPIKSPHHMRTIPHTTRNTNRAHGLVEVAAPLRVLLHILKERFVSIESQRPAILGRLSVIDRMCRDPISVPCSGGVYIFHMMTEHRLQALVSDNRG